MQKTILTLIMMIGCYISGFGQTTDFTVFAENGEKFYLIVEGAKQNSVPQARVMVPGLTEGRYKMKIIFENDKIPALDDYFTTTGVDGQMGSVTYVVRKNNKGNYVMRTSNWSKEHAVTGNGGSATQYNNAGNSNQGVGQTSSTQTVTRTTTTGNPDGTNMNVNVSTNPNGMTVTDPDGHVINMNVNMDPNGNMNMNTGVNGGGANTNMNTNVKANTTYTHTTTTTTTSGGGYNDNNGGGYNNNNNNTGSNSASGYNNNTSCMYAMAPGEFGTAKSSIDKQSFAEEKMKVAKQVIKSHCMSSAQIKEVMSLFSFEDNKLDFAKYAYDYCVDKPNYYQINDAFGFSSSVDALNSYLDGKK